jgi:hypothetical protein
MIKVLGICFCWVVISWVVNINAFSWRFIGLAAVAGALHYLVHSIADDVKKGL